ncbi:hypothetical protein [Rhodococcus sp. NPDC003383]
MWQEDRLSEYGDLPNLFDRGRFRIGRHEADSVGNRSEPAGDSEPRRGQDQRSVHLHQLVEVAEDGSCAFSDETAFHPAIKSEERPFTAVSIDSSLIVCPGLHAAADPKSVN